MEVKRLEERHKEQLLKFLSNYPGENRGENFWRARLNYWWDKNPSFSEATPRGWSIFEGDQIIGFLGNIPTRYLCAGEEKIISNSTTWRVTPEAKKQSIQLIYAAGAAAESNLLFNTTPNSDVEKILTMLRFERKASVAVPKTSYLVAGGGRSLFTLAAGIVNLPFHASGHSAHELDLNNANTLALIDELWTKTKNLQSHAFVRNSSQLKWFCSGPDDMEKIVIGDHDGNSLNAIAVLGKRIYRRKTTMHLLDVWHPAANTKALEAIVRGALIIARKRGCDFLELPHFSTEFGIAVKSIGAWIGFENRRSHFYYGALAPSGEQSVRFSYLEGDLSL